MRTLKLTLAYDGTDFCGWQFQPSRRTVQQTLQEALSKITGETIVATASGRTDAGVHARGKWSASLRKANTRRKFFGGRSMPNCRATWSSSPPKTRRAASMRFARRSASDTAMWSTTGRWSMSSAAATHGMVSPPRRRRNAAGRGAARRHARFQQFRNERLRAIDDGADRLRVERRSRADSRRLARWQRTGDRNHVEVTADGFLYNMVGQDRRHAGGSRPRRAATKPGRPRFSPPATAARPAWRLRRRGCF